MDIQTIKASLQELGTKITKGAEEIAAKAADESVPQAELQSLDNAQKELKERYDLLNAQKAELEKNASHRLANSQKNEGGTQQMDVLQAKASLFRNTINKRPVTSEVRAALGDGNGTGGEKLLPKTVSDQLLQEPGTSNPFRKLSVYSGVTNLEIPKIDFTLDNDDFIGDGEVAKEVEAEGSIISFTRNKFKVFADVSETILAATDTDLVAHIERALQNGLSRKERNVAFAKSPKETERHMSFYGGDVKEVVGESKYEAITKALADLHEDFRENANIIMRYTDYLDIVKELANGNTTLFMAPPEQVLGKPVVFCDSAVDPIVGDFQYSHFNYEPGTTYEQDKNVKTGINQFVLTAYFDHRLKLKSAFRIAKVDVTP
ncbi:phage major capsid protein [Bacillus safensis]|uniref:phage major capsid protein n=1 Tax=Bacillus safensis TaxID=561879 RepID=UPI0009C05567|nr:phage major capsid protein [Bacillus safensis]ARD57402.1 major capsid protein [Bacillus safensis]